MARADRLLRLIQILRRHRQPVSAAALARELEVSMRSVYRDIQTLRGRGASIDGEAGIGYILRPGYLLPPLMFSDDELEAQILGLRLVAEHGDEALKRAAVDVVAKLRAVLPKDLRDFVDDTALLAGPAPRRAPDRVALPQVRRAIRAQRKVELAYLDARGRASRRVVWPIALGFFERVRVIVAWCESREAFRTFRTDRITGWRQLAERLPRSRQTLLREWRDQEGIPAQLPG
jgi:predicted DNA-binding transcriptional regulator YafY